MKKNNCVRLIRSVIQYADSNINSMFHNNMAMEYSNIFMGTKNTSGQSDWEPHG